MVSPTSTSTPFPNLSSTAVSIDSNSSTTNTSFQLPRDVSRETILLSWAHLLRGYTSSDAISFSLDSETVVEVDFSTNAITEQAVSESISERGTAIYFLKVSSNSMERIEVHPDLDAGMAYLWATSSVVPQKQLENIAAQLAHILSSSPTSPESKISFPKDGPELSILNPHPQKLEGPELLHDLIPSSCPEALALDFLNADESRTKLSYAELHAVSDKLAAQICQALAATEAKTRNIPILLPQSPELYVAQVAILKAGAAFVPLNLDAPLERVKFVAGEVGAGVVLTNSDFLSVFSWEGAPKIITFEASDLSSLLAFEETEEFVPPSIEPKDAAYIMFTSGSTGAPKGVTISHTAAAQSFLSHNPHIPPFSRFLQFAAPTFDVSVFDTFFPLFRSSTLVGCARSILLTDLPGTINRLEVDAIELTPTVANELLGPRDKVPGLKYLLTIGEMLTQGLVNEWAGGALQGMYGPTEAAIHCTLAPDFHKDSKVGNIGIPLSTVSCFVVSMDPTEDGDVEVLPTGWVGELAVGGHQLADGYLNRPDLTSKAFIETAQYGRLYRTGDRARILVDGTMECLGRVASGQVKLRGQRVELGEIEAVILKTPGIKAAVTSVVEGSLVAYVSTTAGVEVTMDEVKETCKLWLPGFMVPGDVVFFSDLPRLASGKADRKRLDADYIAASASRTSSTEEQLTETEEAVAGCVQELLGRKPAKDASLVAQGLDSLQAIRLVSKLRAKGLKVEVIDIASVEDIQESIERLISAHEILRTGFIALEEGFAQVVYTSASSSQFAVVNELKQEWSLTLDQLLDAPFKAALLVEEEKKTLGFYIHHALYDGWSFENLLSDLQLLLRGVELPQCPQYRSVVHYELSRSTSALELATDFWGATLSGAGSTRLPSFHGRHDIPPGVGVKGSTLTSSRHQLEAAAKQLGVSNQVLVQAAWAYLLSSYTGKDDIVFGTVSSGRTVAVEGIERISGPTILTLPVRVQNLGLNTVAGDVLKSCHEFNRSLLEHSIGLREIRKKCGEEGAFDTLIVWQQTANERAADGLEILESRDKLEFTLLLEIEPVGDEIKIRATYKEEILPTKQVDSILAQLSHLISAISNNPTGTFKQLLAGAPAEVLSIANPFPELIPQPSTRTLATCFEDSAAAYPDHVALEMTLDIHDGQAETIPLTYTQLNCASNQLARALVSRGVKPDELVAVFMEKSLFCYVAILATVKAGAGYLPLQHETPTERARTIIQAAGMINIFSLDLSEFPDENLGIEASSKGLAYAVFTSGSTGVPKGVLVEHEQAVGMLDVLAEMYPTAPGKRLLQFCNIAFDVSVFEIFFAWHRGMVLSSATKDVLLRNMEEAVNAMHVTHLSMTPTVAALMRPENVPRVEFLVTSGEAVTKKVFNDWAGHGLWQGYGPSETTNICTVNPAVESAHDISNIGPPFANTSAFVVAADEEELVLLPAGSVGELCFGGVQVCRGYLDMPELTARKFMTHPVYGRIYRSGDMGRILPNDDIIFQGRQDDQVKIRGQRIELGEINSILLKDRSVVVDAVTLVINKDNSPQLVSFVVPTEFQKSEFAVVDAREVRDTVNRLFKIVPEFVPAYMVPNSIIAVSEIPMTVQGKTDKRILTSSFLSLDSESLDLFSGGGVEEDGEEWTETERTVAAVVAKVAHADLDTVGRNTSIFNLGLDSISAIQLSIQLKAAGFQRLDISQIMKNAKISSLARLKILPCTPLQESTLSSKELSTSLLALGQSAWARLLSVYTGEQDVCFGNVVSGRTIPVDGVEGIIAPCFNTIPLRVTVSAEETTGDVVNKLMDMNNDAMPYQLTPLRRIMGVMKTEGAQLFDTLFILQSFSAVVELVPNKQKDQLEIVMHFRRNVVLEENISILLAHFDGAIKSALQNTEGLALDLSGFDASLLSISNQHPTVLEAAAPGLLHTDFETNARDIPDHIALEYLEDNGSITQFTFAELNAQANKLAHHLLSLGITRDEAVPIWIEKSPLYYICVLAILKAGAAFTPIDPSLPASRKKFMIEELQAKKILAITGNAAEDLAGLDNPVLPDLEPRHLAYRIYTSGSTGLPKAVSLEHRNAVQTFEASRTLIPWKKESRLLQFAATTFDMCYYDIFMALRYGFTLCSASKKHLLGELEATITKLGVTMLDLTPTVAATLTAENLPDVELLYCIGEAMPQKLSNDWAGRCVNSYGPTEAAMCVTIVPVSPAVKSANIGKPFETTSFLVVNPAGQLVPVYGAGELCIGGSQVAREYHNNPVLTEARFVTLLGERYYLTGDVIRMLGDGSFEFIGRKDDQVKIRGLRVELDEINTVAKEVRDVRDAVTMVIRHSSEAKEQIVTFIGLEGRRQHGGPGPVVQSKEELVQEVKEKMKKTLPRYMVPGVMLVVDHVPLSAAGKVDKKALTALFQSQSVETFSKAVVEEEEELTEQEIIVRKVFSQISQVPVEQISRKSTIYEIGLDSISAAQVAQKLKKEGLQVSVVDILEHGIAAESIDGVFPCTAVQEGMLSQFLRSEGGLYFNHSLLSLPAGIDEEKLRAAWEAKQKADTAAAALNNLQLPPWALTFLTSGNDSYLLFSGHHALYDATTLQIFFQDAAAAYAGVEIPSRPQFNSVLGDIVKHTLDTSVVDSDRDFWLKHLEGSSITNVPNLNPVWVTSPTYHVKEARSSWSLAEIEASCQQRGISLHAAGQAAWARVLSAYTGETAVTLGVVFSGRTGLEDAAGVAFPCLVTLPSLAVLNDKSNIQLAKEIMQGNVKVLKHQHTPLMSIQRWFEHPEESFFDSIFVYQKTDGEDVVSDWKVQEEDAKVDYALSLEIEEQGDKLVTRVTAKDSVMPRQQTEWLLKQFDAALVDILENPEVAATDMSHIPKELLSISPPLIDEIPGDVTLLHKFVEKHVAICPDKVAFEWMAAAVKVPVISAESDERIKNGNPADPEVNDITPENLSYCLYTSGTTGTPKGCELTHENAVQAMYAFQRLFSPHWDADSRFLQFASFHFDVSVLEQFWSWSVGVCVTSAPRDLIFQDLAGAIDKMQITHLDLTPSLAALLRPEDVPKLTKGVFITGGEALKQDILDTWGETGAIYNGYGPTEVTIGMTMYPRVPANGKPSNIGPQFDNVGTYVFARGTETPVARGAVGELCASGKLVGKGYLNRPDLTAKSFPVLKEFGEKIYRTGDLVRLLHDGTFDFLGRADDQVKLRGQRLEIGEINQVMKKAAEEVHAVATLVLRHPKQQKDQLVSFVVLESVLESVNQRSKPEVRTDGHLAKLIAKLVAACKAKLPTYMVPTHFLPISHMPLSVNNKVDNKILKAVYNDTSLEILQQLAKREDDTGAWTESEERLRSILADMTKLQPSEISRSSTIFELGLDSISVVGFTRRLLKAGFTAATASLVMQHPALSQLSTALTQATAGSDDKSFSQVEAARQQIAAFAAKNSFMALETLGYAAEDVERFLPCTPLQEGMIARFLDSTDMVYWNAFPMVLSQNTDIERLRNAWMIVMENTDMLRTCFADTPDGYIQVVLKNAVFQWEEVLMVNENYQEEIQRRINNVTDKNKKLQRPPVELLCIRTPTRYIVSLNIFHALYDGNSLPLVLDDVKAAYNNEFTKRPLEFKDVLAHLLSTDPVKAREFWTANIASSSSLQVEKLLASTPQTEAYSEELKLDLAPGSLNAICKQLQCTPQAIFQAAWASILASYSGPVVTLGLIVSGRSLPIDNIEGVVGPTFNTIPGCFDVAGAASWEDLVKRVQRFNSESLPFHNTPLRSIQKWVKKKGLFETLFAYQKGEEEKADLWEIVPGKAVADYALALEVTQNANGEISMAIVAKAEFDQNIISDILGRVADNVYAILKNPASAPIFEADSSVEQLDGAPDSSVSVSKDDFTWSPTASTLKATIAGLAEVDESEITADSSILELGLDSIEAIKLSSRLRQKKIMLSVSLIMRNPTIRKMIAVLSASSTAATESKVDKIAAFESNFRKKVGQMDNVVAVYPTTPLQEAMIAETLASDYKLYFNHDMMKLESSVDLEKLKEALKQVVEKNDILRTSFASVEDEKRGQTYAQLVHSVAFVNVKTISVPTEDAVQDVIESVMENTTRKADLLKEAPVYFTIVTGPESRHLVLSISHALYDGWSIGLLHDDIKLAYYDQLKSRPSQKLLIENIVNTDAKESKRFWSQVLKGAVPSSFTATAVDAEDDTTHRAELKSAVSYAAVQEFCKKSGVTAQSIGQTCWLLLLAHQLGETDVMFGSVLSGRDFEEAERIMFPAMNTVPVRAILHGTYEDMVGYVQQSGAAVLKYQHTPLREIQKITGGRRLFDSIFLYQRSAEGEKGEKLYESVGGSSDVEYAVAVEMERSGDSIFWRNACKPSYFSLGQADELLAKLDNLLAHIIANPSHPAVTNTKDGLLIGNLPLVKSRSNPVLNGVRDQFVVAAPGNEWSATESQIRKIITKISGLPEAEIERTSTIFHLGLDSISAIRLSSDLRKAGFSLTVAEILKEATIERMASAVEAKGSKEPEMVIDTAAVLKKSLEGLDLKKALEGLPEQDVEAVYPATAGQVYMLDCWESSNRSLFMPTFVFKTSSIPIAQPKKSWEALVQSNPILRTVFRATGNEEKPFTHLFLTIHHALYDGVSLPMLLEALISPVVPTQQSAFADYLALTHTADSKQTKEFYTSYLKGARSIEAPATTTSREGRKEGVSLQALFMASFARVLGNRSNTSDVVFGIYLANRNLAPSLPTLMAPTLNIVPLRVDTSSGVVAAAKMVQGDLAKLTGLGTATLGLRDTQRLSGVKVEVFFNFLMGTEGAPGRLEEVAVEDETAVTVRQQMPVMRQHQGGWLRWTRTKLDVEVAVRNGMVDVGVFGYLDREELEAMIKEIIEGVKIEA
ncbi:hypothetical protein BZA77DRAFT_239966 [Pyronema omphalodes]|nr:hypothetical protein BZA77DRAFT_239966 [Pyronema omphalodes]